MSYYVNQARVASVSVAGTDVTERVLSWTVSDSTLKNVGCMQTTGELVLGQETDLSQILNYGRNRYKRGTEVIVEITKLNGDVVRHPRGLLYVLSDSFSPDGSILTLDIGCRVALASLTDDVEQLLSLAPTPLDAAQNDFQSISGSFAAAGKYVYQDNQGALQTGDFFEGNEFGSVTPGSWVSVYGKTAISVSPLQSSGTIPDSVILSYQYPSGAISEDNKGIVTLDETESNYFINYPGTVYIRSKTGEGIPDGTVSEAAQTGVTTGCGNSPTSPGQGPSKPNSCSDGYTTESATITQPAKKTQQTQTTYDGPGGQISYLIREVRGPALEVNSQYYADAYAACRFSFATACNPGGNCPLEGMETIKQAYIEEFYSYDESGALTKRTQDQYKNVLAAAQPFNWRSGSVNGRDQGFIALSALDYYLANRTITEYYEEDGIRVEKTTNYISTAETGAGTGRIGSEFDDAVVRINPASQVPNINGTFTNLATSTDGDGTGMQVNATISDAGGIIDFDNFIFRPDIQGPFERSGQGVPLFGGSGTGVRVNFVYKTSQNSDGSWSGNFETFEIVEKGLGYRSNELLFLFPDSDGSLLGSNGTGGTEYNFLVVPNRVTPGRAALSIAQSGEGYEPGDVVFVEKETLRQAAASSGQDAGARFNGQPNLTFSVRDTVDSATLQQGASATQFRQEGPAPAMLLGAYRGIQTSGGSGVGAVVDLFVKSGGGVKRGGLSLVSKPTATQKLSIETRSGFRPTGGSGEGLVITLRLNRATGSTSPDVSDRIDYDGFNFVAIDSAGNGYKNGDLVTIPGALLAKEFNVGLDTSGDMVLQINDTTATAVEVFADKGGSGYEVGDILLVSSNDLVALGATKTAGSALRFRVTQITSGVSASNISIDAMNGIVLQNINRSATVSTLPDSPDIVNSPVTQTQSGETVVIIRPDQSLETPAEARDYIEKTSIPVPLLFTNEQDIQNAVETYERYYKSFLLGDALGLQIVEGLRDDIVDSWKPGLSFRYYDPRCDKLIALRMDAVTWGITPTESACSINGIFLGESNGSVSDFENVIGNENVSAQPPTGGGLSGSNRGDSTTPNLPPETPSVDNETTLNEGDFLLSTSSSFGLQVAVSLSIRQAGTVVGGAFSANVEQNSQFVVDLTGEVVAAGELLATGANGEIPYSYNGTLLTTFATVLLDPFST